MTTLVPFFSRYVTAKLFFCFVISRLMLKFYNQSAIDLGASFQRQRRCKYVWRSWSQLSDTEKRNLFRNHWLLFSLSSSSMSEVWWAPSALAEEDDGSTPAAMCLVTTINRLSALVGWVVDRLTTGPRTCCSDGLGVSYRSERKSSRVRDVDCDDREFHQFCASVGAFLIKFRSFMGRLRV